jgi:hypothetical protein
VEEEPGTSQEKYFLGVGGCSSSSSGGGGGSSSSGGGGRNNRNGNNNKWQQKTTAVFQTVGIHVCTQNFREFSSLLFLP